MYNFSRSPSVRVLSQVLFTFCVSKVTGERNLSPVYGWEGGREGREEDRKEGMKEGREGKEGRNHGSD